MDSNKIVTYSLLAHINNHSKGIKDFTDIFLPLIKRVLAKMNSSGIAKGLIHDIKETCDKTYAFDIPYSFLLKLLKKIAFEVNSSSENDFTIHQDKSFVMRKYIFVDYEESLIEQDAEIESLKIMYEKYLQLNNLDVNKEPSIFEYLDKNRVSLSQFFAGNADKVFDNGFLHQANFIISCKDVPKTFKTLKKIYLGSIISSYLEIDYSHDQKNQIDFVLDTNFIVSVLDLHSIESTHTAKKILEVCSHLSYHAYVLENTIDETRNLLLRTADQFNNYFLVQKLDVNSIYNACERLNLNKTDLEKIASNLESTLEKLGIIIIRNTLKFQNIAKYSKELELLKKRKNNPEGAMHDAIVLSYVKEKRGKRIRSFYESNCWFVTDSRFELSSLHGDGTLPETIRAEELVNILWLTNPRINSADIGDIGLTKLVSSTITHSLPNTRIIKELDENIQKYAKDKIDAIDCVRVANLIANKTITNLEDLNSLARKSPDEFILKIKEYSNREKSIQKRKESKTKQLIEDLKNEFQYQIIQKEKDLKGQFDSDIKNLKNNLAQEKSEAITNLRRENREQLIIEKQEELSRLTSNNKILNDTHTGLVKNSQRYATYILILFFIACVGFFILLGFILRGSDWNRIEWITFYVLGTPLLFFIVNTIYFLCYKHEFSISPASLWKAFSDKKFKRLCSEFNFDLTIYNSNKQVITKLEEEIRLLRQ